LPVWQASGGVGHIPRAPQHFFFTTLPSRLLWRGAAGIPCAFALQAFTTCCLCV